MEARQISQGQSNVHCSAWQIKCFYGATFMGAAAPMVSAAMTIISNATGTTFTLLSIPCRHFHTVAMERLDFILCYDF